MTGPLTILSRYADKRVALPAIGPPQADTTKAKNGPAAMSFLSHVSAPRAAAPSPLKMSFLNGADGPTDAIKKSVPQESKKLTPMDFLLRGSEADDGPITQHPVGTLTGRVSPARITFSTDTGPNAKWIGGHYVRVSGIKEHDRDEIMRKIAGHFSWGDKILGQRTAPSGRDNTENMYLCFDDVRQAASAIDEVLMARNHWETEFVSFNEYSQGAGHFFDGQVIFTAEFVGQISQVDTEDAHFAVQNAINKFGDVLAQSEIGQSSNKMQYRVEYYQISSAHKAIAELSGQTPRVQNDWIITAKEMEDPIEAVVKAKLSFSNLKKSDEVIHSPSGRTAWTQGENGEPVLEKSNLNSSMAVALRRPMMPPPHNKSWHSNGSPTYHRHGNQWLMSSADIYIDDIEQGVDVRTTIMLRNIPNSWTYLDLKERIDPFVFGRYDFSYLRFDFGSSTNVGYGFINLLEASDIIPLYRGLIEQFWVQKPGGAWSGKKAHLSYATMQGIDTLIDKFRNSAIMDEFHGFCPKMWYTDRDVNDWETGTESSNTSNSQLTMYGGPHIITRSMVGTCRPFPPPDNETKHRRSNNNATTMGLYPPLHLRGPDGPYRGGSNFDWGTTHQMMDDFRNQFGGGGFPNGAFFVPMPPQIMAGYGGFANNQYPHGQPPRNQFHQNQYLHHGGNGYGGNGYGKNYHNSSGNGYSNNNYHHHGGSVQYGNNYQHHNGYDNAANHYQQSGGRGRRGGRGGRGRGGRGGPRGGFVSNDARVPRTFDYDGQSMDGQNTGGFNELGGKIYST